MRSKAYQTLKKSISAETLTIDQAIDWLKENTGKKFDETVELHIHLGIDPSKSDQMVRGQVVLPSGSVTKPTIIVFTDNKTQQKAVLNAGATAAGGDELIQQISTQSNIDGDIAIALPSLMGKLATIAKVLGPKGLMPNPKTGTVTDDPEKVIKELLGGKINFKMDQQGNIHQAIAKISWDKEKIVDNVHVFIAAVKNSKPAAAKGTFIKSISIKSTMSPAVRIVP